MGVVLASWSRRGRMGGSLIPLRNSRGNLLYVESYSLRIELKPFRTPCEASRMRRICKSFGRISKLIMQEGSGTLGISSGTRLCVRCWPKRNSETRRFGLFVEEAIQSAQGFIAQACLRSSLLALPFGIRLLLLITLVHPLLQGVSSHPINADGNSPASPPRS